jgi:hypothetical protein
MIPIKSIENASLGENADVIPCSARLVPTPSFNTIIDPLTRNTTIKLFPPFKLIKRLDIDI